MPAEVVLRPGWEADLESSPDVKAAVRQAANLVADEAGQLGREVAQSYRTTVEESSAGVRVIANAKGRGGNQVNAAGWIEVGTGPPAPTAAHAPLRRGAEAVGLTSDGTAQ